MLFNCRSHFRKYTLSAYLRAQRGTAAIEMALLFPVFLLFFMGVFEMGLVWFGNSIISNKVYNAVRASSTGCAGSGQSPGTCTGTIIDFNALKTQISSASFGLIDPDQLCFRTKTLDDISAPVDVSTPGPTLDLGEGNQVRVFYAGYKWKIFFSYMRPLLGSSVDFRTYQLIRNENFGAAPAGRVSSTSCP